MYCVYIMTNRSKTLYVGFTSDLRQRTWRHKNGWFPDSFTSHYKLDQLVYYEIFATAVEGVRREKQIKGWTRLRKMQLIVSINPTWADLSAPWFEKHLYEPEVKRWSRENA